MSQNTNTSKLLSLPAEIRLQIYTLALTEPSNLGIGNSYKTHPGTSPWVFSGGDVSKQALLPSLTLTCRQLHRETLPLFYQLNRFTLAVHYKRARGQVDRWIDSIAESQVARQSLRFITIKHRFGVLDFRGTVDFDVQKFEILGPELWFNAIPPMIAREVEDVVALARRTNAGDGDGDGDPDVLVAFLRLMVGLLGVEGESARS